MNFCQARGAVDRGRLIELFGHRFQRGQIHDEEERRAVPDVDQDHREARPIGIAQPGDPIEAQAFQRVIERRIGGIEHPPPAERRQRQRDHPRHQQHAAPFALALDRQVVDQMRGDQADQRLKKHSRKRENRRLLNHHPEGVARHQEGEIRQADEARLRLVQHRQIDRIEGRIDDEAGDDQDQRHAHQQRNRRAPPHEQLQAARPGRRGWIRNA